MDFLKNLFGKKSDTGLSKKGWLSIAVHRPSGRIITSSKGLMGNAGHWGEVGFLVENRIDDSKRHYDFVPDEEIIGFIVENIEKVPTLDKAKPEAFEHYLKGLKEQKRVSIRAYQYRKVSGLKESDPLPPQYQTWVRLQDSRELMNRHTTDLRDFKKEIERRPFDTEALVALMQSYLTDSQLFGKFILAIAELKELDQRIQLYTQLEQVIEESSLYKQSRIEEMDYFLMIPPGEMEPIHVLACETLRDVLRKDCDGRLFGIPKSWLKGTQTYDRLCKMMLDYHTLKGLPLDYIDDEYNMKRNYSKEMEGLIEATRLSGEYDETDSDAYPGLNQATPPIGSPSVPIDMGSMLQEEERQSPVSSLRQLMDEPNDVEGGERASQTEAPAKAEVTLIAPVSESQPTTVDPVVTTPQPPCEEVEPPFDEQAESAKSIQRLAAGALLRDEIYSWRDREAITRRQLEWAFSQPYINAEKLIRNGTLHGAVLKTRYFEGLFERVASGNESLEELSLVDRNILLAYGTSMEGTRAEYDGLLREPDLGESEKAAIKRQKVSLESEYGRIQEQIHELRLLEQQRLIDSALQLAERWLEHFFAGTDYARLSNEAFFQQLEDYTEYPNYIQTLLPVMERLGGAPKEQRKRSFLDLFHQMERFHSAHAGGNSGARFVSHEDQQGLTAEQCGWGQVIYQLGFFIMERERLRQESDTDINAVCEMIQLHIRIGKKLQGWMLHALYWVIDTEDKIKAYCERVHARYTYALESYLAEEKEGLEPFVLTEADQRLRLTPLQAALPQSLLSAFSRWYNAEEVWRWYYSGEARPGGFQPEEPAEGQPSRRKRDRKKGTVPTVSASARPSEPSEAETDETPDPSEVKAEGADKPEQVEGETTVDATQPSVPTEPEVEAKEAEPETDSGYEVDSMNMDDSFADSINVGEIVGVEPTANDEDEDEELAAKKAGIEEAFDDVSDEDVANLQEEAQADELVEAFNEHISSLDLTYGEEEEVAFGGDTEALAHTEQDSKPWKWAESHTLSNLGQAGQSEIEEWTKNFAQELSIDIDQQMALFICCPADLGRRIYSFFSRSSHIEEDIREMSTSMSALEKRIKGKKSIHTLELICKSAKERFTVLASCLDLYKKSQEESKE